MTTVLDQLHKEVHDYVNQLVLNKVLPAISQKWNIPLDQLKQFVASGAEQKSTAIQKSSGGGSGELTDKVAEAKSQSKYYNIATGKFINDTAPNRKKYTFYKDLAIAGLPDDEKTLRAVEQLGGSKKPEPLGIEQQIAEELALEASSTVAKKRVAKKVVTVAPEEPVEKPAEKVEEKDVLEEPVEDEPPLPRKRLTSRVRAAPVLEEPPALEEHPANDVEENPDQIVKLSEMIEEKEEEVAEKLLPRYNSKVRAMILNPLGFAHRKVGEKIVVFGKLDPTATKLIELSPQDMEECKRRSWVIAVK